MSRRSAFSILEMMVVIAVSAVLLAVATMLLHTLLLAENAGRDAVRRGGVIGRLADQFRRDAHAATRVEPLPEGRGWRFERPQEISVTYEPESGGLSRTETVAAEVRARESFVLPSDRLVAVEIDDTAEPRQVSLRLLPAGETPGRAAEVPPRIDAVLGFDHRFAGAAEGGDP